MSLLGPVEVGCFGPISQAGCFGPIFWISRFGGWVHPAFALLKLAKVMYLTVLCSFRTHFLLENSAL